MDIDATLEHLLACWDRTNYGPETSSIARWCGWSFAEALGKMLALRDAGHVPGAEYGVYPSGPHEGLPLWFWGRPEGVRGLPIIEDPRLLLLGVQRAVVDHDRRVVTYQGARPLEVYRSARKTGERIQGYRLDWLGPDPTARAQLELPVGVELERPE